MYISETASVHLGLPQIDLTGSSIFEYIHPSDHNDIHDIINLTDSDRTLLDSKRMQNVNSNEFELSRSFCIRMKCILPKRNAGLVSSGYKAIHCNGYLKVRYTKHCPSSKLPSGRPTMAAAAVTTSTSLGSCYPYQQPEMKQEYSWESYALIAVGHSLLPTASTEIKLSNNSFMFRASLDLKLYYVEAS